MLSLSQDLKSQFWEGNLHRGRPAALLLVTLELEETDGLGRNAAGGAQAAADGPDVSEEDAAAELLLERRRSIGASELLFERRRSAGASRGAQAAAAGPDLSDEEWVRRS
jgi:hypothetical protein